MKKENAMELFATFPPEEAWIAEKIRHSMKNYLIVGSKESRCTRCESTLPLDAETRRGLKHRANIMCPNCMERVEVIKNSYNFSGHVIEDRANFVVFQNCEETDWLYVRCYSAVLFFNQYELEPTINIIETQRYIFDDKHSVRYGRNYEWECHKLLSPSSKYGSVSYYTKHLTDEWVMRTKYDEPKFEVKAGYELINEAAIGSTCMRHCMLSESGTDYVLRYLNFYQHHRGAERLIKAGLADIIKPMYQYYYRPLGSVPDIDWKQTEPHKMLGITRPVVAAISAGRIKLDAYKQISNRFPNTDIDKLVEYNRVIGFQCQKFDTVVQLLREKESRILKYLRKQGQDIGHYDDYLRMCLQLDEDIDDRVIRYPKDLNAAHERVRRTVAAIKAEQATKTQNELLQRMKEKRKAFEFEWGDYIVRQPESVSEISAEGKALHHCVGGYAERHANGALTIMFLRRKEKPDTPYYTIEVGNNYRIVQCRGAYNNRVDLGGKPKTESIKQFEERYQEYLYSVAHKQSKTKVKVSA